MATFSHSKQPLRKRLEEIIDTDDLILHTLIFFCQDVADVSPDLPASSIIDKVNSSVPSTEYKFLKLVFEQINQQFGSPYSQECFTIIAKLSE